MFVSAVMFRLRFSRCFSKNVGPHESLGFINFVFHNRGTIHALLVSLMLISKFNHKHTQRVIKKQLGKHSGF